MNSTTYTIANWNTGMSINPQKGERPEPTPRELIVTRAVETKDGWLGQVIIDSEIVWETDHKTDMENPAAAAVQDANAYVIDRIKALFL
jgi:hypothetical protein